MELRDRVFNDILMEMQTDVEAEVYSFLYGGGWVLTTLEDDVDNTLHGSLSRFVSTCVERELRRA